jgi:hypothetical protein
VLSGDFRSYQSMTQEPGFSLRTYSLTAWQSLLGGFMRILQVDFHGDRCTILLLSLDGPPHS